MYDRKEGQQKNWSLNVGHKYGFTKCMHHTGNSIN